MTNISDDGLVRTITGDVVPSLHPPLTKRPREGLGRRVQSPKSKINGLSIVLIVIWRATITKLARIH